MSETSTRQGTGTRPMRADAVKNRSLVLEAAEAIFAEQGVGVPIDEVARRAGVGVGTVYRHFPTKEDLFEAIVVARLERLLVTAKSYGEQDDAGEALFRFLRTFSDQAAAKRDLIDALGAAGFDFKSQCTEMIEEMMASIDHLLQRAVAQGAVRDDVTTLQVVSLITGACHACQDTDALRSMIGVVIDGLQKQPIP